jgi:hypothetical protein
MQALAKIVQLRGGLDRLRDNRIRLKNPPYMRLVIERVGTGPRGLPAISVADPRPACRRRRRRAGDPVAPKSVSSISSKPIALVAAHP